MGGRSSRRRFGVGEGDSRADRRVRGGGGYGRGWCLRGGRKGVLYGGSEGGQWFQVEDVLLEVGPEGGDASGSPGTDGQ